MKRVLLLIPTTSYRTQAFVEAAHRLGISLVVGSEKPNTLADLNPNGLLTLDYHDLSGAVQEVQSFSKVHPLDAVVGVDDQGVVLAAELSESLDLPRNPVESVTIARDKYRMRKRLENCGVPQPRYQLFSVDDDEELVAEQITQSTHGFTFPCVAKPLMMSASRGVIRANDERELVLAFRKIRKILQSPDVQEGSWEAANHILVEEYIDGIEVAVEGLVSRGDLRVLAIFDKPDPLVGPFFEETIYVTPSRLPQDVQSDISSTAKRAAHGLGLQNGPVHAEVRINSRGCWLIELAARSIGGYCSRALRFVHKSDRNRSVTLEEILLRDALGMETENFEREGAASGVMMIPIPSPGVLSEVHGVEAAKGIRNVQDVVISIPIGGRLIPLPEGGKYLGFIFSRAETPDVVEAALREAHRQLEFAIAPEWKDCVESQKLLQRKHL